MHLSNLISKLVFRKRSIKLEEFLFRARKLRGVLWGIVQNMVLETNEKPNKLLASTVAPVSLINTC